MPQGKLKVKAKIPPGAKVKSRISKPKDVQKKNRPAPPKKMTNVVRAEITKAINEANETSVKERAVLDGKTLHVAVGPDEVQSMEKSSGTNKRSKKS